MLAVMALTGCATVYEGKYSWSDGWRKAEVLKVGTAGEVGRRNYSGCAGKVSDAASSADSFAVLSYSEMGRKRHRVVALRPGDRARAGDRVYVNLASCDAPLPPRVVAGAPTNYPAS